MKSPPDPRRAAGLLLAGAAFSLGGCLGGGVLEIREFRPAPARGDAAEEDSVAAAAPEEAPLVRLGRVTAAGHLRDRFTQRLGESEYRYYEEWRWADPPARLVEEELAAEVYRRRGFRRPFGRAEVATLDVHVLAFEEVLKPDPAVEVRLVVRVGRPAPRNDGVERLVAARAPLEGEGPRVRARAYGAALDQAVIAAADFVEWSLGAAP